MEATKLLAPKLCIKHPGEPIVRCSLDPTKSQLLYCNSCIENLDPEEVEKMPKWGQLLDKLHEELTKEENKSPEDEGQPAPPTVYMTAEEKEQALTKIRELIVKEKAKADEEYKTIETEITETLKSSKEGLLKKFDKLKSDFEGALGVYMETVGYISGASTVEKVTKEEIDRQLQAKEGTEEAEKKIRKLLDRIQTLTKIKSGQIEQTLVEKKNLLDGIMNIPDLVVKKDKEYYRKNLEILSAYFKALVFANKEKAKSEHSEAEDNESPNYLEALQRVNELLEEMKEPLGDRSDEISQCIEALFQPREIKAPAEAESKPE